MVGWIFLMRNVITHELLEYSWDIYFVSIDAGAQVAIIFTHFNWICTRCGHKLIVGTMCGHI